MRLTSSSSRSADRKLRRGEVIIRLTSPTCEIVPPSVKLFVDEHVDAPAAIFTVKAIQPGPAALIFSVWQDDGQIASVSHPVQVVDAAKHPSADISARSSAIPVQTPAPPWGIPWPRPGVEAMRTAPCGKRGRFITDDDRDDRGHTETASRNGGPDGTASP